MLEPSARKRLTPESGPLRRRSARPGAPVAMTSSAAAASAAHRRAAASVSRSVASATCAARGRSQGLSQGMGLKAWGCVWGASRSVASATCAAHAHSPGLSTREQAREDGTQQLVSRSVSSATCAARGNSRGISRGTGFLCKQGVSGSGEAWTQRPVREAGRPARGARSAGRQRAGRRRGRAADRREPARARAAGGGVGGRRSAGADLPGRQGREAGVEPAGRVRQARRRAGVQRRGEAAALAPAGLRPGLQADRHGVQGRQHCTAAHRQRSVCVPKLHSLNTLEHSVNCGMTSRPPAFGQVHRRLVRS
jgi:hypothetical protein